MIYSPKLDYNAEKYLKKLLGMRDVEAALLRLDKLTQEEARMAAAESLTITRRIDDTVKDVDEKLEVVDVGVKDVINGELLFRLIPPPNRSSAQPTRCKGKRNCDSTNGQSIHQPKLFVTV
jgi:hypothetical protein